MPVQFQQFGPDGRLYVIQQNGVIKVYDITQPSTGQWSAVEFQSINLIENIPNHDDDGSLNASIAERQVMGLLVRGTAANPVIYVTSSAPRIATFSDLDLDTNSGILSKLTWNGTVWSKVDLIRGLAPSSPATRLALMEYTSTAFNGEIKGDLITASFDSMLKLIRLAADGTMVPGVTTLATPGGTPLNLVRCIDGTGAHMFSGDLLALGAHLARLYRESGRLHTARRVDWR